MQRLVNVLKNLDLYPKSNRKLLKSISEGADIRFAFLNDHCDDVGNDLRDGKNRYKKIIC